MFTVGWAQASWCNVGWFFHVSESYFESTDQHTEAGTSHSKLKSFFVIVIFFRPCRVVLWPCHSRQASRHFDSIRMYAACGVQVHIFL